MRLFNNYWFRWFAGGFLVGASIVGMAGTTDQFKDLKVETLSGSTLFTDASAWVFVGTMPGIFGGVVALGTGGMKKWIERA